MTAAAIDGSAARCHSCQAPVLWVKTEARGQAMPLDPKPHPEGNVVMIDVPQTRHQVARVLPPHDLPIDGPAYRSHFVTCPNHRKRPARQKTFEKQCGLCGWTIVGVSLKSAEQAFDRHYTDEHHDRCESCRQPVLWVRAERDMRILALDPEPVDVIGQFILTRATAQTVAREIAPGLRGLRLHQCPEGATVAQP